MAVLIRSVLHLNVCRLCVAIFAGLCMSALHCSHSANGVWRAFSALKHAIHHASSLRLASSHSAHVSVERSSASRSADMDEARWEERRAWKAGGRGRQGGTQRRATAMHSGQPQLAGRSGSRAAVC